MAIIFYAYYETKETRFNLEYFLEFGGIVDAHFYIFIINGFTDIVFPSLANLRVLYRSNRGYDFGAYAAGIHYVSEKFPDFDKIQFFVFLNASVIGPITHQSKGWDWVAHFHSLFLLDPTVRLYSTSIVCLSKDDKGGAGPKVEGFFWCTDRLGLDLLRKEETIFINHPSKEMAILQGEYGLTHCLFHKHGFNIGCILTRYQGIQWRDKKYWHYNNNRHPSRHKSFYGESMNPYETIFHKWHWHDSPQPVHKDLIDLHIQRLLKLKKTIRVEKKEKKEEGR